jgi:NADH-quinone oxidoreductase subunit A
MAAKYLAPFGITRRPQAKLSAYECGFNPFSLRRTQIDIKFFLLALLFLVFDIEILLVLPFAVSLYHLSFYELVIMNIFLTVILLSILWEVRSGALTFA